MKNKLIRCLTRAVTVLLLIQVGISVTLAKDGSKGLS
jgi:hypothetical protein